jgi:Fe2+ or Zn2+ uptake regulation protein
MDARKQLIARGIKSTYQRMKIMECIERMGHPDAKELYQSLVRKIPSLSKTTVYNTVETLHEAGLLNVLSIAGEGARYEVAQEPHCHFLCRNCGKIFDMDFSCSHAAALQHDGYIVEELLGCFKGVCKSCHAKGAKRPASLARPALKKPALKKGR